MRVLVVATVQHPLDARVCAREIGALLAAGHEVTYAAAFHDVDVAPPAGVLPVNVPRAQRLLGCMPKTAQGAIEKLVALGILQQVDSLRREGRGRPSNLYRCGEVLDIVRE